jgi:hypothetical protein
MLIVRCTGKLLKELKLSQKALKTSGDVLNNADKFNEWYANIFYIDRKKCLICTNAKTLYTIYCFGINKEELTGLAKVVKVEFGKALLKEGVTTEAAEHLLAGWNEVLIDKTIDKSILGSMNDYVRCAKWRIYDMGGFDCFDREEIRYETNRMPMSSLKYNSAREELKNVLACFVGRSDRIH